MNDILKLRETEKQAGKWSLLNLLLNIFLALTKIITGIIGHSYALIADGIESCLDIFSSLVTFLGLRIAAKPPDDNHPYGHGKAESLAGLIAAGGLVVAAIAISVQSILLLARGVTEPPAAFTLVVLVIVIAIKITLALRTHSLSRALGSKSLRAEAWHHGSDAITSGLALVGTGAAVLFGPGFEKADVIAALFACVIIFANGFKLARASLADIMDTIEDGQLVSEVRGVVLEHLEVHGVDKCRLRASGYQYIGELHLRVDGTLSVTRGHEIAHEVKDTLQSRFPHLIEVIVHVEPIGGQDASKEEVL